MKIILIGYMGSGKSTIGKALGLLVNIPFVDLDSYIEEKEKQTIHDIFKTKGEVYFRKQEHFYLKELLQADGPMILSLGGGTPCFINNEKLLFNNTSYKTVYLNVSVKELADRLLIGKASRPLISHINSLEEMQEFVGKHLFERTVFYNKSEVVIDANKDQKTILEKLVMMLF